MITSNIMTLIKRHDINLKEESVVFAFKDGTVGVSLDEEDRSLKVDVEFVDRVINLDGSIESLIEGDIDETDN